MHSRHEATTEERIANVRAALSDALCAMTLSQYKGAMDAAISEATVFGAHSDVMQYRCRAIREDIDTHLNKIRSLCRTKAKIQEMCRYFKTYTAANWKKRDLLITLECALEDFKRDYTSDDPWYVYRGPGVWAAARSQETARARFAYMQRTNGLSNHCIDKVTQDACYVWVHYTGAIVATPSEGTTLSLPLLENVRPFG